MANWVRRCHITRPPLFPQPPFPMARELPVPLDMIAPAKTGIGMHNAGRGGRGGGRKHNQPGLPVLGHDVGSMEHGHRDVLVDGNLARP